MIDTETRGALPAYRSTLGAQLHVWCDHERVWHLHGAVGPNPGDGDGHRVGHCLCPNSPYSTGGYVIEEVGRFTQTVERQHGRRARPGRCPTCPQPHR